MIRTQRPILLLLIFFFITAIHAFIPLHQTQKTSRHHRKHNLAFFDGWFGFNNKDPQDPSDSDNFDGKDVDVDGIYTGSKRIITIPGE